MNETKSRPLIFSAPMVRAILNGEKSQTRRVIKDLYGCENRITHWSQEQDKDGSLWRGYGDLGMCNGARGILAEVRCPYGKIGDHIYVKETHYIWGRWVKNGTTTAGRQAWRFKVETPCTVIFDPTNPQIATSTTPRETCAYWKRTSMFMPKRASRITLQITDIRIERLNDISEDDAKAEGVKPDCPVGYIPAFLKEPHAYCFAYLWDKINGEGAWEKNDFVWVLEFRVLEGGVN